MNKLKPKTLGELIADDASEFWNETMGTDWITEYAQKIAKATVAAVTPFEKMAKDYYNDGYNAAIADMEQRANEWLGESQ